MKSLRMLLLVIRMSLFFIPIHAASVPTFETGILLEQPIKPIVRSLYKVVTPANQSGQIIKTVL